MTDFRKIAAEAAAAHAQSEDAIAARRAAEREQSEAAVAKAVAALNEWIMPVLNRAISELALEGITAVLKTEFDVVGHYRSPEAGKMVQAWPFVKFQCRTANAAGRPMDSASVFFTTDGDTVTLGTGRFGTERQQSEAVRTVPVGDVGPLIEQGVTFAVEKHFAPKF